MFSRGKELVKAGGTRFGTNTLVGKRLLDVKAALQQTVVDPDYVAQNYKDLPDEEDLSNCEKTTRQNKGGTAKALALDDDGFWPAVQHHVHATEPVYKLLRRHDSSAPSIGKVYHGFYTLGEHFKGLSVDYKAALVDAHEQRWLYGHCDIVAAAYALDPEYADHDHASNEEVTEGLLNIVEKFGNMFEVRARRTKRMAGTLSYGRSAQSLLPLTLASRPQWSTTRVTPPPLMQT